MRMKALIAALSTAALAVAIIAGGSSRSEGAAADGAGVFRAKCAMCHAADGSGNTAAGKAFKVRDLRSADVQRQSDDQLFEIVAKGKGKMPAFEKTLGVGTCRDLVAFIRTLKG